ncbi:zinc ribbon domain-containing protein [Ktedonosporobacter rubrisoli]|uniref:Zinc ribbon domain-containing protein n=1 Tax=Ktedonosporobacter rubrisoli TaxID=2509675 RepID=A0A4P6JW69_KTERU|nr:FmdB family zinc ribbon protein [Ktedonosporobacter rubrisoli]QBD79929.1 zinc ribbon domain-containing protein [Ktedonosporobacter rubrisoli]
MPTYEYLCQTCNHRFETWQKMSDEPLTVCPECGSHIRRVLYPAGIVFKGHGFYKTDHGNGALPAGEGKKSESASASSETSTASESKASSNGASEKSTGSESKTTSAA